MSVYLHIDPSADETPETLRDSLKTLDAVAARVDFLDEAAAGL